MINKKKIKESAVKYYKEWVEGEPLTHEVPIDCYVEGAQYVLKKNKKNYKKALKTLEVTKLVMIQQGNYAEWLRIENCLRLCAGMSLIKIDEKL